MIKATMVVQDFYKNNRLFDMEDRISNRDDCLYGFHLLKEGLLKQGIALATQDIHPIESSEIVIYNEMPKVLPKRSMINRSYLLIFESELIRPDNWQMKSHDYFRKIFTWHDDLVDNRKYIKVNFSMKRPEEYPADGERDSFCVMIAGNKAKTHPYELYSERVKAIRWFERNHPEEFDLYGTRWDRTPSGAPKLINAICKLKAIRKLFYPEYPSYRGTVPSKYDVLSRYKFAICYENAKEIPGYITEKIFDCFFAGCIPIYWGAPNINDYVPENAFIDRTKFGSYEELYEYLITLPEDRYLKYLENIRGFVSGPGMTPFLVEEFARTIVDNILEDRARS